MRALKCKVLMLSTKIDPKEPGKFFYRQNRWKHIDEEQIGMLKLHKKANYDKIFKLKRKFYFSSKPRMNLPQPPNIPKYCNFSKNSDEVPFLSTTPNQFLKKEAKIKELCYLLTQEEIEMVIT